MRRILSVLAVTAVMLMMMVTSLTSPAFAQEESPNAPQCGWYYSTAQGWDPWWEYWCWWPGWGWEFVFWTWA